MSTIINMERKEAGHTLKVQRLVYFINEVLSHSKACYPQVQKLLYVVLITKRKLRHYLDGHHIVVVSSSGLGDIIDNREFYGHIAKWGLELMGPNITYVPRTTVKCQVLVYIYLIYCGYTFISIKMCHYLYTHISLL